MPTTTQTDPAVARGELAEAGPDRIVLALPGTDYRLHLAVSSPVAAAVNKSIAGRITASARRVDVVQAGGRYIEPVYGRPRRLQGAVVAADPAANTITVNCGCPFVCRLTDPRQSPRQFTPGQLVSFDIERGAAFHERLPSPKSKAQSHGNEVPSP